MAIVSSVFGAIFLLGSINLSAAKTDPCGLYAAVGQSLTLPFIYNGLTTSHVIRWTHNSTILFYRQQGRVSVGKEKDITPTGSLILKNLQLSSAGVYDVNVLHPNGTFSKAWSVQLCMMEKAPKPKVTYSCDFKASAVKLNCDVAKAQGLVFSWSLDEKTLTSEKKQTLSISLAQLKGERNFTCSVENKVSQERSDIVRPTCKAPVPSPPPSVCFKPAVVVAVLGTGATLILLLLITVAVLCCSNKRRKNQMRPEDTGAIRMLPVIKQDSISPEYETMHPNEDDLPAIPLEPSVRECYEKVSQPEAQSVNKPPQLSSPAEGQEPSPVPKPRRKGPQMQNN